MMRLKELKINSSTYKLEVDIMEYSNSFAIIVCDGKAKVTELPLYGETKIITHQGKIKRIRFEEGEEF
jgi:Phage-like element PBSX protein XtrA